VSQTVSPFTGRRYGRQRTCRTLGVPRSTLYAVRTRHQRPMYRPRFLGQSADDNHAATSVANASRTAAGERWPWRPISHSRL
jgi:hypothetical protein